MDKQKQKDLLKRVITAALVMAFMLVLSAANDHTFNSLGLGW